MQKTAIFLFICTLYSSVAHASSGNKLVELEKESFLYQSKKLVDTSIPETLTYEYSDPKRAIQTASVWMDCEKSYKRKDLDRFKQMGIQAFYLSCDSKHLQKKNIYIKNLDLYQGLEADFELATKNYEEFARLYLLTEVKEKDWKYLPKKPPFLVDKMQLHILKKDYPLITDLDACYLSTPPISGVDKKFRRWIYPSSKKNNIPLLNFFDPTFLANRLASAKIIEARKEGKILELPQKNEGLNLFETELLSKMIRKYGGYSYQKLELPIEQCKAYSTSGPDLISHSFFQTAFIHGFISKNTNLLKDLYCKIQENDLALKHFIHSQNQIPICYSGNYLNDLNLQSILIDDLNTLFEKETYFLKVDGKKVSTSSIGLCACKLGLKNIPANKKKLKKAHLLMTFFHAMQPGVFSLSTEDIRGVYHDYDKHTSCMLYPPLQEQLVDPLSFCSKLQTIIRIRALNHIDQAKLISVLDSTDKEIFCYLLENSEKELILIAINFSDRKITEDLTSKFFQNTYAIDLFSEKSYPKAYKQRNIIVNLQRLEAKCLALKKKNSIPL